MFVTHDQEEAFSISDRVAIMDAGRIRQFDTPEVLYQRPSNAFVARFVGFENLIPLTSATRQGSIVHAKGDGGISVVLDQEQLGAVPDRFTLATRPDGLRVSPDADAEGIPSTLGLRTYLGRAYHYQAETPAGHLVAAGPLSRPLDIGATARLVPELEQCCILPAEEAP